MAQAHETVLLAEAVDALAVRAGGIYVDATFGRGGHSRAILARLGEEGRLLVVDRDPQAIAAAQSLAAGDARVAVLHEGFAALPDELVRRGWQGRIDGLLLDLGVSSPQLDDAARGFSFMRDGPLDMRMNPLAGQSAAKFVATAEAGELEAVFRDLGEERHARRIARAIVRHREQGGRLDTTLQLAELVAACVPGREPGKHPATRVFQALRIHVNAELDQLRQLLDAVPAMLAAGGRLVVISFHSLEDRIVKHFIRGHQKGPELPRGLPVRGDFHQPLLVAVGKAMFPSDGEVARNPRARSAVLRVAERTEVPVHG
jgi:16S rRNA (cytosine1402-N4)-methyltransferase